MTEPEQISEGDEPAAAAAGVVRHRPHRPAGRGRGRRVMVRYAEEEYAAVAEAAGRVGLTASGYVAAVALAAAGGGAVPVPGPAREALVELMRTRVQLRRFGTNVNQAVAALHATGEAPGWLGEAVRLTARAVVRVDEAAATVARRVR